MAKMTLTDVLYALSDPLRLRIVRQLAEEGEMSCGTFDVRMPKSSLSHHFKVLRDAGVIATRGEGVRRMNSLRREALDTAFPGLLDAVLAAPVARAPRAAHTARERRRPAG